MAEKCVRYTTVEADQRRVGSAFSERGLIIEPMPVTPGGHETAVWASRLAVAPNVALSCLVSEQGWQRRQRLVVVSAHPDDESLGCGRLMHSWSRTGPVAGLTMSAGEACVDHVAARPDGIADRRLVEWGVAMAALGAEPLSSPRLPDGALGEHEAAVVEALETVLGSYDAASVVVAAPWRRDPHPDHAAVGRVAARVAARWMVPLLEYPVWMTYWSDPDTAPLAAGELIRVDCGSATEDAEAAVARALSAFVSQTSPLGPGLGPVLPAAMLEHHREQLVILSGRP